MPLRGRLGRCPADRTQDLDNEIRARLAGPATLLPSDVTSTLQTIVGNLYVLVVLGPSDGREWGQSHKLTKGEGGLPP